MKSWWNFILKNISENLFLRMQKWLFLTPLFTQEYLRTKMSTSNSKVPDMIWWLKLLPDHFFTFTASSRNFIPYLDCKILRKCTLKSCLRYGEGQAAWTVTLNVRNFSKELLLFFKLPRSRNLHVNMLCSITLRLYWITVLSLHL